MAITLKDLTELRHKITEGRKKLEEQEAALRVLEGMIADSDINSNPQGEIDLGDLPVNVEPQKPSLVTSVQEIIKRFGSQEFTVAHIESVLEQQGNLPKSKSPRASIAMALHKLREKGVIERTYKGVGSEPHKFKNEGIKNLKILSAGISNNES